MIISLMPSFGKESAMHELNDIARTIPNMGFALFGIYMAHTLYKTPRKLSRCVLAWLGIYAFWIAVGIPLDAFFLNNPTFPGITHERICMFIGPAAVLVYHYLFPQLSVWNCVFSYFMVDNCLILMILFSRTLSEILGEAFSFSLNVTMITVYLTLSAVFLILYKRRLCPYIRKALEEFRGTNMKLLAIYALLSYFGTLFVTDVWAPWPKMDVPSALHNFASVLVPLCGYGMAFRIAAGQSRIKRLEKSVGFDSLTGLKNRSLLFKDAQTRLDAGFTPLQILFLDLDFFKSINDNFGHFAGDSYLCCFAKKCTETVGEDGEVYRIGGDEFVILYHGNRIDALCAALEQGFDDESCPKFRGISIGKTTVCRSDELEKAISDADKKMYEAKAQKKRAYAADAGKYKS